VQESLYNVVLYVDHPGNCRLITIDIIQRVQMLNLSKVREFCIFLLIEGEKFESWIPSKYLCL